MLKKRYCRIRTAVPKRRANGKQWWVKISLKKRVPKALSASTIVACEPWLCVDTYIYHHYPTEPNVPLPSTLVLAFFSAFFTLGFARVHIRLFFLTSLCPYPSSKLVDLSRSRTNHGNQIVYVLFKKERGGGVVNCLNFFRHCATWCVEIN